MKKRVFEGLVVLEVSAGSVAASFAGMLMADNGARVIKIEPPTGDRLRAWSVPGFLVWNRGKESLCLDLETEEGRDRLRGLMTQADVVIDGLAIGRMRNWGLEYDDVRESNPGLIYAAIRGFGEDGPHAALRAYEAVVAAKVGFFNRGPFSYRDEPEFLNVPVISLGTGYLSVGSVAAALLTRESNGLGQRLVASMFTAANSFDTGSVVAYQFRKRRANPDLTVPAVGGRNRYILYGCSSDNRWFVFFNMRPYQAQALVRVLGRDDLLEDPKNGNIPWFDTADEAEEFELEVMQAARQLTGDELHRRLMSSPDVSFEELRTTRAAFDHPQVIYKDVAVEVSDERLGVIREVGPIAHFSETPSFISASAPELGQNRLDTEPLITYGLTRSSDAPSAEAPLAGFTILELGHYFAMPYGLSMAASLGARVIKVEGGSPDPWRMLEGGEPEVLSATCLNGKESVSIDLRSDAGREILLRLVAKADAVVYSLRPDPASIGLCYDDLRKANPDLVYICRPGYGYDGPFGGRPMYASTADAMAGMFMRKWGYWLSPERCAPAGVLELKLIQVARINSGGLMYGDGHGANALFAMTAMALLAKTRFGVGQSVESSMMISSIYGQADDFLRCDGAELPAQFGDEDLMGMDALYRMYKAADEWVFVAAPTEQGWKALVEAIGRKDLLDEDRLATAAGRRAADAYLVNALGEAIARETAAFWEETLNAVGVGCAIASGPQIQEFTSSDPGLRESGLTFEVEHPTLGPLVRVGAPASFSSSGVVIEPGTVYGQNTTSVLAEIGFSNEQIQQLISSGVAVSRQPVPDR